MISFEITTIRITAIAFTTDLHNVCVDSRFALTRQGKGYQKSGAPVEFAIRSPFAILIAAAHVIRCRAHRFNNPANQAWGVNEE